MKIGEKVRILEIGRDYFGSKYTGTDVEIEEVFPDGGTILVKTFDGIVYVSPKSYVEPLDIPSVPDIITSSNADVEKSCTHSSKRWTVITGNLKYWFCPDCKEEVK